MNGALRASKLSLYTLLALLFLAASPGPASAVTPYTVTELGALAGGSWSWAYDINEAQQVVGWADAPTGDYHAVLWDDGTMHDLGTLGGSRSEAYAINASGQVVGEAQTVSGDSYVFLWEDDVMHDLGILGCAHDINQSALGLVGVAFLAAMRRLRRRWLPA